MKQLTYILIAICLSFCTHKSLNQNTPHENKNNNFKVIVNFEGDVISNATLYSAIDAVQDENIRELLAEYGVVKLKAAFTNRYDTAGFLKPNVKSSEPGAWQQIILNDNEKAEELIAELKKEKGIINAYIERPLPIKPCVAPTDPSYSSQWHLNSGSSPLADINAEQAWNINTGRNDVIIAVCDGGIDYTHPDLDPGNRSRVIAGYDFASNDNNPMDDLPEATGSYGGHGTHIAGIIGAIPNNGRQVSGVMWNCKIMPIKMVGDGSLTISYPFGGYNWDFSTTAFPSDVADAIDYAVNNGAHVINLSYGFPDMGETLNQVILRVPLLHSAILNAYNNNVVVVASMGNEYNSGNPTNYPAAFPDVIAVGNTNNSNPPSRYSSSSTGSHICVSAPGYNILSTTRGGGIGSMTGTSMSAPVVSGVAGLIISQGLDRNFNLTNDDVRHILERTAHDVTSTGVGFDNQTGYGIVDAYEALHLLDEPNELFHSNSVGGTSVKTQTISQWILLSSRWGLAAGTYLNVDQYKITKHVTFDVPFCSTPQVWMRDRESKSMSYANPNSGRPFSIISNVTNTGFDLEYVAYYVPTNTLGQTINKWIPDTPASTNVAYTAVGQPNPAGVAGPLNGSAIICPSGTSYTLSNVLPGTTVSWTCSSNIWFDHQTGNPKTFTANGTDAGWIQPILITNCGNVELPRKDVWNVPPTSNISFTVYRSDGTLAAKVGSTWMMCPNTNYQIYIDNSSPVQLSNYNWTIPSGWTRNYTYQNIISINTNSSPGGPVTVSAYVSDCNNNYTIATTYFGSGYGCSGYYLVISPNPSNSETLVELKTDSETILDENLDWHLDVYDSFQGLKEKKTKLKTKDAKINTSDWKEGVYIIRANVGDKVLTEKMIVKH